MKKIKEHKSFKLRYCDCLNLQYTLGVNDTGGWKFTNIETIVFQEGISSNLI